MQTNTTKLFKELRKQGYVAEQRTACCRSCVEEEVEVYTTRQSYNGNKTWVYFKVIEGTVILEAVRKLGIPHIWDGTDKTAFTIIELGE